MKKGISIADISGSHGFIKANPHLFAPAPSVPMKMADESKVYPTADPDVYTRVKKPREMTQTEREFEAMLRREFPLAEIRWEWYTLKLGAGCRYTPDFAFVHPQSGRLFFFEVKGAYLFKGAHKSATTASLTKPKAAATLYPQHRFFVSQKAKDGTWTREEYQPA